MKHNNSVAVLVDSKNIYYTARENYDKHVDYQSLLTKAVGDRKLKRAIAYVVENGGSHEQSFFDAIENIGFETKRKEIQEYPDGTKKADWDVGIALDAVTIANHVDTVVLASGDGDFTRLLQHLREKGVKTEVMCFEQSTSDKLRKEASHFINLTKNPGRYLLK